MSGRLAIREFFPGGVGPVGAGSGNPGPRGVRQITPTIYRALPRTATPGR